MNFEEWAAIQGFTDEELVGPLHELEGCWRAAQEAEREECNKICLQVWEESNNIAASVCAGRIERRSNK